MPYPPPRGPLIAYLRVQEFYERELLTILRRAAASMQTEINLLEGLDNAGAVARRAQLRASLGVMQRKIASLWRTVGSTVTAGRIDAAIAAADSMSEYLIFLSRTTLDETTQQILAEAMRVQAQRQLQNVATRDLLSRIDLAESVYKSGGIASGQLERLLMNHLARGSSAREIAKDVRRFINPNVRGGLRYAAMRLGRTELNNAFHGTQIRLAQGTPWILAMRWNLSGSHPRPDACNDYAEGDHEGLGDGVFSTKNVPGKPHPQCLCFCTPVTPSREEFVQQFAAGHYDSWLDQMYPGARWGVA